MTVRLSLASSVRCAAAFETTGLKEGAGRRAGRADMKLKLMIGGFEVSYSGSEEFAEQKLLNLTHELIELAASQNLSGRTQEAAELAVPRGSTPMNAADAAEIGNSVGQLSDFLRQLQENGLSSTTRDKFLATSAWLHLSGYARITSGNVAEALQEHHETALSNPSHCLNLNIERNYCERDGKNGPYFVTTPGFRHLGLDVQRSDDGSWKLRGGGE